MGYLNDAVNTSATIVAMAGGEYTAPAMRAFLFDDAGYLVPAGAGKHAAGVALASSPEAVRKGDRLTVQIKDVCPAMAGAAFKKGEELAADGSGRLIPATAGAFILATALESAADANSVALVQIVKAGYK